jgi:hypothetical protein
VSDNPCAEVPAPYTVFGPRRIIAEADLALIRHYAFAILTLHPAEGDETGELAIEIMEIADNILDGK